MSSDVSERLPGRSVGLAAALGGVLLAYTVLVAVYLAPRPVIANLDFWYHLSLGYQLQWDQPPTLVNGLYPLGYPFLLSAVSQAGIDALRFGQVLSWGGGLLALAAAFLLLYQLTRTVIFPVAGTVLLLLNAQFFTYVTYEGNDMLAAGLQAAAVAALWYGTREDGRLFSRPLLALHGILLGFSYLTRYTALIFLPISLVYLLIAFRQTRGEMVKAVGVVALAFGLTTAVQWGPSWLVHRDFFYNEQAKNVWFGIYGEQDWVNNWGKVPDTISLRDVIGLDPARFFEHWLAEMGAGVVSMRLWPLPFHVGWILAIGVLVLGRQPVWPRRLLLLMVLILPLGVTALAWLAPRFLLVSLWMQGVLIVWLVYRVWDVIWPENRRGIRIVGWGMVLAAILLQWRPAADLFAQQPITRSEEVNHFLRLAGMERAEQVATNDPYLHVTDEAARSRYDQVYFGMPNPESVEAFLTFLATQEWNYLVLDFQHGFGGYGALRDGLRQAKSVLVPLELSDGRDIYCVVPCFAGGAEPIQLTFPNGMVLVGYRRQASGDEGAVYLYWKSETAVAESYKVSVRVWDGAGRDVVQLDHVPQLWTFPTTAWRPGEVVVDFYQWRLAEACDDCVVALVVYDEASQEALLAMTGDGQEVGPVIPLWALLD